MRQSIDELLREYHRRNDEAFLESGTTPYRLAKQLWQIHGEMSRTLAMEPVCVWSLSAYEGDYHLWEAECGQAIAYFDGGLAANDYHFCPNCGRPIQEHVEMWSQAELDAAEGRAVEPLELESEGWG